MLVRLRLLLDGPQLGGDIGFFIHFFHFQPFRNDHPAEDIFSFFVADDDRIANVVVLHIFFQPRIRQGNVRILRSLEGAVQTAFGSEKQGLMDQGPGISIIVPFDDFPVVKSDLDAGRPPISPVLDAVHIFFPDAQQGIIEPRPLDRRLAGAAQGDY